MGPLNPYDDVTGKIINRPNFWRLSYLSDTRLSARKMFHLLLKKMFLYTTTFKLFGAETRVAETRQASKIWINNFDVVAVFLQINCVSAPKRLKSPVNTNISFR